MAVFFQEPEQTCKTGKRMLLDIHCFTRLHCEKNNTHRCPPGCFSLPLWGGQFSRPNSTYPLLLRIFKRPQVASVAQVLDPELRTKGRFFQTLSAVLALANLIELGLEADYKCSIGRCEPEPVWELLTQLFTILPLAENLIRLVEAKPRRFFCGEKTKVKYKLDTVHLGTSEFLGMFFMFFFVRLEGAITVCLVRFS